MRFKGCQKRKGGSSQAQGGVRGACPGKGKGQGRRETGGSALLVPEKGEAYATSFSPSGFQLSLSASQRGQYVSHQARET